MVKSRSRNISQAERWGSMVGGAALTLYGVSRLRPHGWILATFGVLLFRRGATGHCYTYDVLGVSTAEGPGVSAAEGSSMLPPHGDPLSHQLR